MKKNKQIFMLSTFMAFATLTACQAGQQMNYNTISMIQRGSTTEQDIRATFGEPVRTSLNSKAGTKTLYYVYKDNDDLKKGAAGVAGAVAGGLLGSLIGDGSGRVIATTAGAAAGGALGANVVNAREKKQELAVVISLSTGKVIDYNYTESGSRTQSWRPSTGPGAL